MQVLDGWSQESKGRSSCRYGVGFLWAISGPGHFVLTGG